MGFRMTRHNPTTLSSSLPTRFSENFASYGNAAIRRVIAMSGDDDSSGWQLTESDPGVFT
jgi:hypothetical protein